MGEHIKTFFNNYYIDYDTLLTNKYTIYDNLLSSDSVDRILNGTVEWEYKLSSRRSKKSIWLGCNNINEKDIRYFGKVTLPSGRIDINLPTGLVNALNVINEEKLLKYFPKNFRIASYQLLITPGNNYDNNQNMQVWHQDHGGLDSNDYYTLLIPLVDIKDMGKTEVKVPYTKKFDKNASITTPNVTIGDGLLFSGSLWHRGTLNNSNESRYCLYIIISRAANELLFESWK